MRDYRNIKAWQEADDLTVAVYEKSRVFPREELYALTSQIRRAAYSVPANIAEGSARGTNKDYLHFLHIARASRQKRNTSLIWLVGWAIFHLKIAGSWRSRPKRLFPACTV